MPYIFLLAHFILFFALANGQETSKTFVLTGTVYRGSDEAIVPVVEIKATSKEGKVFATTSRVSGAYKIELPMGSYDLLFFRQCYKRTKVHGIENTFKAEIVFDVRLEPGACSDCGKNVCDDLRYSITGVVRDQTGAIIPGVKVAIVGDDWSSTTITDDEGAYFAELPEGNYKLKFSRDGHKSFKIKKFRLDPLSQKKLDVKLFAIPTPII